MEEPEAFMRKNEVSIEDKDEMRDLCLLLKDMLAFDKVHRITIQDVLKSDYFLNYH